MFPAAELDDWLEVADLVYDHTAAIIDRLQATTDSRDTQEPGLRAF